MDLPIIRFSHHVAMMTYRRKLLGLSPSVLGIYAQGTVRVYDAHPGQGRERRA